MIIEKGDFAKKVGTNIRNIRQSTGKSIEQLAHEANMDPKQLRRIELGQINTSIYHIYLIANTLQVNISEIFINIF